MMRLSSWLISAWKANVSTLSSEDMMLCDVVKRGEEGGTACVKTHTTKRQLPQSENEDSCERTLLHSFFSGIELSPPLHPKSGCIFGNMERRNFELLPCHVAVAKKRGGNEREHGKGAVRRSGSI
jgi:hypothetical protein